MIEQNNENIKFLFCIGLSHKKSNTTTRGNFAINKEQKIKLLQEAKILKIEALLAISTCNRTELYGIVKDENILIELLCKYSKGTRNKFNKNGYILNSTDVIDHFYRVAGGLDSQIIGDFEIISQIKSSVMLSKTYEMLNSFMDRLISSAIQTSKKIKNQTELSIGAASVSFAAANYILSNVKDTTKQNILLYGAGKIGRNTCENLVKHIKNKDIRLINRTIEKAKDIAYKYNLTIKKYEDLTKEINRSDILIVATGALETDHNQKAYSNR